MNQIRTAEEAVTQYFQAQSQGAGVVNTLYASLAQALTTVEQQKATIEEQAKEIAAFKAPKGKA